MMKHIYNSIMHMIMIIYNKYHINEETTCSNIADIIACKIQEKSMYIQTKTKQSNKQLGLTKKPKVTTYYNINRTSDFL